MRALVVICVATIRIPHTRETVPSTLIMGPAADVCGAGVMPSPPLSAVPHNVRGCVRLSISGDSALPSRMAYMTPSGSPPLNRIRTVIAPISAP